MFFNNANDFYEASEGKYISIVRNEKIAYYNVDFNLLTYNFIEFAKGVNLTENAVAKIKIMFSDLNKETTIKSKLFLINILVYYGLTAQPKSSFFYLRILGEKLEEESYFEFDSVGINRMVILDYLGKDFETNKVLPITGNTKNTKMIAMGPKAINTTKKKFGIATSEIVTFGDFDIKQ